MISSSFLENAKEVLCFPPLTIEVKIRRVTVGGQVIPLTTSEFQILYLLACSPGEILAAKKIYRCVWQMDDFGNVATVHTHIWNLRHKLFKACPEHAFIKTVWKQGYIFTPPYD